MRRKHFFQNFPQSSCDVALALLKKPTQVQLKAPAKLDLTAVFAKTTTNITHMAKYKLEYIWLDGYEPVANLRGKTQIKEYSSFPKLEELPLWGFDGSSTRQAEGHSSDCILKPVAVFQIGRASCRER